MNTRAAATIAIFCLASSTWVNAQPAKGTSPESDKPSAASEMPRASAAADADAPKARRKAPAPRLNMEAPAKNPGTDKDVRNCLDLPTNPEIIKCAQKK